MSKQTVEEQERLNVLDVRVVERHITERSLSREDLNAYLADLEDCADMAEPTVTRMVPLASPEGAASR